MRADCRFETRPFIGATHERRRQREQAAPQERRERVMLQNFTSAVRELQRTFSDAFNAYRPELYYMRGPGPACRSKAVPKASAGKTMRPKTISKRGLANVRS
jgi:hypothetical protein